MSNEPLLGACTCYHTEHTAKTYFYNVTSTSTARTPGAEGTMGWRGGAGHRIGKSIAREQNRARGNSRLSEQAC